MIRAGILKSNRDALEQLHRGAKGPFTAADAGVTLGIEAGRATRLLAYFAARGWLTRIRKGLYVTVPLGAHRPSDWREDTWIVATRTFAPCYIGGWSALEHWGLTEQLFRDTVVFTARKMRRRHTEIQGARYRLRSISGARHFGTRKIWRGQVRVDVSDPTRTIVDVLAAPELGGGIRHVAECVTSYFEGEHRSEELLLEYSGRLGNRTVFKRLGHMVEVLAIDAPALVDACFRDKSAGLSALDPAVKAKGRVLKRWNLRVNVQLSPRATRVDHTS